jgi:hypothetical protein
MSIVFLPPSPALLLHLETRSCVLCVSTHLAHQQDNPAAEAVRATQMAQLDEAVRDARRMVGIQSFACSKLCVAYPCFSVSYIRCMAFIVRHTEGASRRGRLGCLADRRDGIVAQPCPFPMVRDGVILGDCGSRRLRFSCGLRQWDCPDAPLLLVMDGNDTPLLASYGRGDGPTPLYRTLKVGERMMMRRRRRMLGIGVVVIMLFK